MDWFLYDKDLRNERVKVKGTLIQVNFKFFCCILQSKFDWRYASGSFRKFAEQKAGQKILGRTLERMLKSPDLTGRVSIYTPNSY